jgi:deoxyribodipyrimidine photo-lyase
LQGEKFDPEGAYVKRWVPELAKLPSKWIHQPYKAPPSILSHAEVELGKSYPDPVVNHVIAREVALEAYNQTRGRE